MSDKEQEQEVDWLEGDPAQQRAEQRVQAIAHAQLYLVFVDAPRGRELLESWEELIVNVKTPVESSIQKYAADEAVRDFIRGIRRQIKLAQERDQ